MLAVAVRVTAVFVFAAVALVSDAGVVNSIVDAVVVVADLAIVDCRY